MMSNESRNVTRPVNDQRHEVALTIEAHESSGVPEGHFT
jgi:hypothetical protein